MFHKKYVNNTAHQTYMSLIIKVRYRLKRGDMIVNQHKGYSEAIVIHREVMY